MVGVWGEGVITLIILGLKNNGIVELAILLQANLEPVCRYGHFSLTSFWECFRSGKRITSVNIVQYCDRESIYYTSCSTHRSHGTYEAYRILIFLHSMENSMLSGYDVE